MSTSRLGPRRSPLGRRNFFRLVMGGAVFFVATACGKKGPPNRADGSTGMKIDAKKKKKAKTGQ